MESTKDFGDRLLITQKNPTQMPGAPGTSEASIQKRREIDVVIPVYNAYDVVARCLESLHAARAGDIPYRLILIDDASTDPRVYPFLEKALSPGDLVLKNPDNLGFVRTANRGMSVSQDRDVVLLNSDTAVAEGWLEALQKAAYWDEWIGGANPLSNHASIFSVPELSGCKDPAFLKKISGWLKAKQKNSIHEIPTAVAHCFFIKREVIERVGLFDEAFGKGYGEENDFCLRAHALGYRFVLTDKAFVYHEGHVSMRQSGLLPEGQELLPAHQKILESRYPAYPEMIGDYVRSGIMENTKTGFLQGIACRLGAGRPKILYFLHHPVDGTTTGGLEFHVWDLVERLKDKYVCYVARVEDHALCVDEYLDNLKLSYVFPFSDKLPFMELRHQAMLHTCWMALAMFEIDLVHMHLTMNNTLEIAHAARILKIPLFISLHDYYCVSPDPNLFYKFQADSWNENAAAPRGYFYGFCGAPNFNAENWRLEMAKALRCADEIFVPSRDVLNRVRKYFKRQRGIRVIEHGVPVHSKGADPAAASPAGEKLSLCFLGYTHAAHKGGLLLDRIVPGLLARNIEVHFLGSDASRWKQCLWAKGVRFHGAYRRNEVVQKIRGINPSLIAIPSLAPETYSYTLSEAWMAGVPVVVPPIGALEERVRVSGGGIVLHDFKPETFLETVSRLAVNGVLYRGLQEAVSKIHLKTTRENAAEYRAIYESRLVPRSRAEGVTDESIFRFKSDGQKNYWRKIGPDAQKKKWSPGRMLLGWRWAMVPRVRAAAARLLWRPGTPEEVNGKVFDADRAIFACIKD